MDHYSPRDLEKSQVQNPLKSPLQKLDMMVSALWIYVLLPNIALILMIQRSIEDWSFPKGVLTMIVGTITARSYWLMHTRGKEYTN